jgi:hypothetical protein
MSRPLNYRIYPTLLDSFNRYLAPIQFLSEDEGAPTEEELKQVEFKELINKINRVPYTTTEAQAKGVAMESCLNAMLDQQLVPTKEDKKGNVFYTFETFEFAKPVVDKLFEELAGYSTRSERISCVVSTPVGMVELYGVMDYSFPSVQVDLKTTKKYDFLKYQKNTQHRMYPFIAKQNGIKVDNFAYLVTDFKDVFAENYTCSKAHDEELISNVCQFADFLENNRHLITDRKIFGGENPDPAERIKTTLF